jgi:hypothetical protein
MKSLSPRSTRATPRNQSRFLHFIRHPEPHVVELCEYPGIAWPGRVFSSVAFAPTGPPRRSWSTQRSKSIYNLTSKWIALCDRLHPQRSSALASAASQKTERCGLRATADVFGSPAHERFGEQRRRRGHATKRSSQAIAESDNLDSALRGCLFDPPHTRVCGAMEDTFERVAGHDVQRS